MRPVYDRYDFSDRHAIICCRIRKKIKKNSIYSKLTTINSSRHTENVCRKVNYKADNGCVKRQHFNMKWRTEVRCGRFFQWRSALAGPPRLRGELEGLRRSIDLSLRKIRVGRKASALIFEGKRHPPPGMRGSKPIGRCAATGRAASPTKRLRTRTAGTRGLKSNIHMIHYDMYYSLVKKHVLYTYIASVLSILYIY